MTWLEIFWSLIFSTFINAKLTSLGPHNHDCNRSRSTNAVTLNLNADWDFSSSSISSNECNNNYDLILPSSSAKYNFHGKEIPMAYSFTALGTNRPDVSPLVSPNGRTTLDLLGHDVDYHLLAYAQDALNLTARFYQAPVRATFINGSWIGMAALLEANQIELAVTTTYFLRHRAKAFRFVAAGFRYKLSAYFQIPPRTTAGFKDIAWNAFRYGWPMEILFIVFHTTILIIIFEFDVSSACLLIVGNISQQGITSTGPTQAPHRYLKSTSIRIVFYVICLGAHVINVTVTSTLISKFSTSYKTIENLQDLMDEGYHFGIVRDSYLINIPGQLEENAPKSIQLKRIMANGPSRETLESGLTKLLHDPKFAFITEQPILPTFKNLTASLKMNVTFCDILREILLKEEPVRANGFTRKGSNLSDPINFALTKMWENGNARRYWNMRTAASAENEEQRCPPLPDETIHLPQLKTPFISLFVGLAAGLIGCAAERLHCRLKACRTTEKYPIFKFYK